MPPVLSTARDWSSDLAPDDLNNYKLAIRDKDKLNAFLHDATLGRRQEKGPKYLDAQGNNIVVPFGPKLEWLREQSKELVNFLLITSDDPTHVKLINNEFTNLDDIGFQKMKPTCILVHGWNNDVDTPFPRLLAAAHLAAGRCANIIIVDWGEAAEGNTYFPQKAFAVDILALKLAQFMIRLTFQGLLHPADIHMVGYSLGAHACGIAGMCYFFFVGKKVGRIDGLDPAGPGFWGVSPGYRLDKVHADFVLCIFTSTICGLGEPVGHINVFPNNFDHSWLQWWQESDKHHLAAAIYTDSVFNRAVKLTGTRAVNHEEYVQNQDHTAKVKITIGAFMSQWTLPGNYYMEVGEQPPYTTLPRKD